ncbi:MAG: hypothetical protein JXO48_01890 [Deltaproteobacteria bacterium]|nr:hypothetical protein [Deltaproteobacteria bacterium]
MPDEMKITGHLTPSLAGLIASEAGVGKLALTHLFPECDQVDVAAQCWTACHGDLQVAEDLIKIELSPAI